MDRRLIVPAEMRDTARRALASRPAEIPEVAYRLAAGFIDFADLQEVALWHLDHPDDIRPTRVTAAAGLRGGRRAVSWAMASLSIDIDIASLLDASSRADAQLITQLSAAIALAWQRTLDHAAIKAGQRLKRSTEWQTIEFAGWPNRDVATKVGVDDLLHNAWQSFQVTIDQILGDYQRTQVSIVDTADPLLAAQVGRAIGDRSRDASAALVTFLDERARDFMTNRVPYQPQDFLAARATAAWVSGALPAPAGFAFIDLAALGKVGITQQTSSEQALLASSPVPLVMTLEWQHGFYGAPLTPMPAHEDADGSVYTLAEADLLSIWPGDHVGCRCELVPTWSYA